MSRCCALDNNTGRQCGNRSVGSYSYHGESEIHEESYGWAGWIVVPLCKNHRPDGEKTYAAYRREQKLQRK